MPSYRYAWATIVGKVYVDVNDLQDVLEEKFPERIKHDADGEKEDILESVTLDEEKEVFQQIADREIDEAYQQTHDPMKFAEVFIDLSTYK